MKVALELQPCCGNRSGIGIYTYELARHLQANAELEISGNLFNFLGRNDNSPYLNGITLPIHLNRSMPYGVYRRIWNFLPVPYTAFFPHADVTHFFNYIVPPHIKGKVITTIHDLAYLLYPETLDKKNLKRITKDIGYSIHRSEIIITVSESAKNEMATHLGLDRDRIKVVPNAAPNIKSSQPFSYVQKQFGIQKNYLLYVGNLEPRKNIPGLLSAYHKLRQAENIPFQLVIAGQKGWRYDAIFESVASYGLADDVIFTGYITDEDKAALYQNASLFVFPSFYEGFGIPILEAMSAGVPVVCSNTSSMPEVAGDAALLINPADTGQLADAIYRLLTDDALRLEKIQLGKIQAKRFSWTHSATLLTEIYKNMQ